jgi:diaminopimelate decarboxylase
MKATSPATTAADESSLDRLRFSDHIRFLPSGRLTVEEADAGELADSFGTPLYVTSEQQIRANYRRLHAAFASRYPRILLLYANKANNNLAVRRILTEEGAGGDCFGLGELYISLLTGTDPAKLVLNGGNKTDEELKAAIEAGVTVNVDHPLELRRIEQLAAVLGRRAPVNLRVLPFTYADPAELSPELAEIAADRSHDKWGMDAQTILEVAGEALGMRHVRLRGLHMHVSRLRPTPEHFQLACGLIATCMADLRERFQWQPEILDIGGGYAHERDPESGQPAGDHRVATPEEYAEAVVTSLRASLAERNLDEPLLALEPGRRLVSNATVLLARVGIVKRLPVSPVTWVNVDASTNHCLRASLQGYHYEIVHASKGGQALGEPVNITGPTCTIDLIGFQRRLPPIATGDVLAVLDVGGYAEAMASQFNLLPRPASVLVNRDRVEVIRRRETIQDLLSTQALPTWLWPKTGAGL